MTKKYIDAELLIKLIIDDTPICSADGANAEDHDIFIVGEAFAHVIGLIAAAPAADVREARSGRLEWNNHAVACLLAELFDDTCACNYNDIDEWLPEKCEVIDACPNPVGVACWEQFLKHRSGRERNERIHRKRSVQAVPAGSEKTGQRDHAGSECYQRHDAVGADRPVSGG